MSNWFTVILDTIPPAVQVYAPTWTVVPVPIQVRIEMSEPPDVGRQFAELLDFEGVSHPFFLSWDGHAWWAEICTNLLPPGPATIAVTLWDEAGNATTATVGVDILSQAALIASGGVTIRSLVAEMAVRMVEAKILPALTVAGTSIHAVASGVESRPITAGVSKWQ